MNKWISVYDNLPESEQTVLIAWRFKEEKDKHRNVYPHYFALGSYFDQTQDWIFSAEYIEEEKDNIEVIAWMNLPEFYEEI